MEQFWASIALKIQWLLILSAMDLVLGVARAIKDGVFEWRYLAGYIPSNLLPIGGYIMVAYMAQMPIDLLPAGAEVFAPSAVYATVFLKISGSIAGHLSAFGLLTQVLSKVGVKPTGAEG